MARTGPQKIPGASQAYFYGTGQYSGSAMEVNCGVVHTTEGRTVPSYGGGSMAPSVTGLPDFKARKIRWYQHYDVDESARALANKLGGVETNTANAFQIELVGTCDDKYKTSWDGKKAGVDYLHWPTAPDWALAEVAWLVRWLNQQHGIPLTCVSNWLAYGKDSRRPGITPASYGASPARMSMATWRSFKGWCGHQHVPENDHGDPGNLDFARIIQLAKGGAPAPDQEDDVTLTSAQAKQLADIAAKVTTVVNDRRIAPWTYKGTDEKQDAYAYLRGTKNQVDALLKKVDALKSVDLTDEQLAKLAEKVAAAPGLADAIAEKVAQKVADRLAE